MSGNWAFLFCAATLAKHVACSSCITKCLLQMYLKALINHTMSLAFLKTTLVTHMSAEAPHLLIFSSH